MIMGIQAPFFCHCYCNVLFCLGILISFQYLNADKKKNPKTGQFHGKIIYIRQKSILMLVIYKSKAVKVDSVLSLRLTFLFNFSSIHFLFSQRKMLKHKRHEELRNHIPQYK